MPLTIGAPSFTLDKVVGGLADTDGDGRADVGEQIPYIFTVTNTGPVTLTTVSIDDPKAGLQGAECLTAPLAPGQQAPCAAAGAYTLVQADIEMAKVDNTATAKATATNGASAPSVTDSATVDLVVANSITLDKASNGVLAGTDGRADAGDMVPYTFTVKNTGQQTVSDVTITDTALGIIDVKCADALAPGASVTCTTGVTPGMSVRTLTQPDIDAGRVENTATATATPSTGNPVQASDAVSVLLDRVATLVTTTTVTGPADNNNDGRTGAGDTVTVTITLENTGNTTLTDVSGRATLPDGSVVTCAPDGGTLTPGKPHECTVTYTVTQSDADAGRVDVTTTASGTDPSGAAQTVTSGGSTTWTSPSGMSLVKTAGEVVDADEDGIVSAGDTVAYSFQVTNTGATTLSGVIIDDPTIGLTGFGCGTGVLAPGNWADCGPVVVAITQPQIDAGIAQNTATAAATTLAGDPVSATSNPTDTTLAATNRFSMIKRASAVADTNGSGRADAGDRITYSFEVTNTGSQTLTDVAIVDAKLGLNGVLCVAQLAPGTTTACAAPADYVLTQDDVDAGVVSNTASAVATPPGGPARSVSVTPSTSLSTATPITVLASLTLEKQAGPVTDVDANGHDAGDTVVYTFTVTNRSNVTLSAVQIADPMLAGSTITCESNTLAPRDDTTCTSAPYEITQDQVDARRVDNEATVSAQTPAGATVTSSPAVSGLDLTPITGVSVETIPTCSDEPCGVGDQVTYTVEITNTGTTTLDSVTVSDPAGGTFTCPGPIAPGAPPSRCQVPTPHTVTQDDVDRGDVTTSVTVTATAGTATVTTGSTSTITLTSSASVELGKSVRTLRDTDDSRGYTAGDEIAWTFTVTNTGTRTLAAATIADPLLGITGYLCAADLAPGDAGECVTPTYRLTTADVDAGTVTNAATVTGVPAGAGGGDPATAEATSVTP
ncbi:DUF7507 domain-containing protein [Mobilicoccus caccae]|uniref:DUF7507 domain-containing protein n=1 Tax=Mobilicoccus caccae TaxID=1859295 RepID=A0ABQ6IJD1_9MICO|nr:hypothetical protein [Mobilicoccus caccae]GMA38019.1 hypothetical protein GCM10025883_00640 [Mobilicoccus caccae]